jgi:hypothetical protein
MLLRAVLTVKPSGASLQQSTDVLTIDCAVYACMNVALQLVEAVMTALEDIGKFHIIGR